MSWLHFSCIWLLASAGYFSQNTNLKALFFLIKYLFGCWYKLKQALKLYEKLFSSDPNLNYVVCDFFFLFNSLEVEVRGEHMEIVTEAPLLGGEGCQPGVCLYTATGMNQPGVYHSAQAK